MASSRLNLHERYRIHALYEAHFTIRTIALMLDRAPSTVSRELRRNCTGRCYQPDAAHQTACLRRLRAARCKRIDPECIRQIEALLAEDHSPEQIAGRTGLASHEWIYQHIYADQRRGGTLFRRLRRRRRQRCRRGLRDSRGQLLHRRHWSERPAVVETRSRLHLLAHSVNGTAENVRNAILRRLGRIHRHVHTLTSDNGKEFAEHQFIACALKSNFFFADPYSAWQRGSNENANGLARQYLPRRMDFSTITDDYLRWVEQRLYNRPRKILNFKTPLEVFIEESINTVANQS